MKLFLRYTILLTLCFYLIFAGLVQAVIVIEGDTVRVDTDNYTVHFTRGEINYIHNKLTNKTYTLIPERGKRGWTGLMFNKWFWDENNVETRRATLASAQQLSPNHVQLVYRQDGSEARLSIAIDTATDDMLVDMEGESDRGHVTAVQWGMGFLDIENLKVIVPVSGGRVYDHTDKFRAETYPGSGAGWEAQLAIVQGAAGGFSVRNTDNTLKYKQLSFDPYGGGAALNFLTWNQAPFDSHTQAETGLWRFNTYAGDWRVPALVYRDWMEEAFQVTRLVDKNDWVADITLFVKAGLSGDLTGYRYLENFTKLIDRLAELVDPDKTIVYLGGWTIGGSDWWVHEGDIAHPDFIPKEALTEFLAVLKKHGFRTILYITAHGCSPNHPLYPYFQQYQYRDTWTGDLVGECLDGSCVHPLHPLAHISPASSDFRNYVLTQLKAVWDEYDIDGFFIDASHSVMNSATGLVDGLSTAQGMALLHQEMVEMMPGVVLGGERLHEATFVHESFAQRPLFAEKPRRHPISSFLFSPFVHAVDLAPHWYEDTPEHYHRVLLYRDVYDIMPTINIFSPRHLEDDAVETLGIIALAGHWQGGGGLQPDVNGDGQVNVFDLVIIAQNFGAQPLMNLKADVNGDRRIDVLDLIVVSNWIGEPTVPR